VQYYCRRCRTVPLVSHNFLRAHKDYPPKPKAWRLEIVTKLSADCLVKIGSSLQELYVSGALRRHMHCGDTSPGFLAHLLSVATVALPKLESLIVDQIYDEGSSAALHSISAFSQLKILELQDFRWPADDGYGELQHLSGLISLEVGSLAWKLPYHSSNSMHHVCSVAEWQRR
jgi:hypothetical protein